MKTCLIYTSLAWNNVSEKCIQNCFRKAFENAKIFEDKNFNVTTLSNDDFTDNDFPAFIQILNMMTNILLIKLMMLNTTSPRKLKNKKMN